MPSRDGGDHLWVADPCGRGDERTPRPQVGQQPGGQCPITLAWDSLSHVSGALACGIACIWAR
jgi:hypothetical protein